MSIAQPPVLRRVTEPSIDQIVETLKSVNSEILENQNVNKLSPNNDKLLVKVDTIKSIVQNIEDLLSNNAVSTRKRRSDFGKTHNKKQRSDVGKTHNKKQVVEKPAKEVLEEKQKKVKETVKKTQPNLFQGFASKIQAGWEVVGEKVSTLKDAFMNSDFVKGTKDLLDSTIRGLMGPLNLIFEPLSEAFGINFTEMIGKLFGKDDNPKNKGKKVKPTDSDVKQSNPETYWLWKKQSKEEGDGEKGSFLQNLLGGTGIGGVAAKLFPALAKALPIAAIAGSILWGVVDAISAIGKADGWGVTKVSAGIAGFFAGNKEGWIGAFSNAGKWALAGAGIGFLSAGPVGALVGGLIGAAIGGVLGFIGGKEIAKGLDNFGSGIKTLWTQGDIFDKLLGIPMFIFDSAINAVSTFAGTIPKMLVSIFTKDKDIQNKVFTVGRDITQFLLQTINPFKFITNIFDTALNIKDIIKDKSLTRSEKFKGIIKEILLKPYQNLLKTNLIQNLIKSDLGKKIASSISSMMSVAFNALGNAKDFVVDSAMGIRRIVSNVFGFIGDSISRIKSGEISIIGFVVETTNKLFSFVKAGMEEFFVNNPVGKMMQKYVIDPVTGFFENIFSFFSFIGEKGAGGLLSSLMSGNLFSDFDYFSYKKQIEKDEETQKMANQRVAKSKGKLTYIEAIDQIAKEKYKPTKVNDAIITPSGRIIQPSSDDTIIATKSPVSRQKKGFDSNDMQVDLSQLSKSIESSSKGNEIVSSLRELIETIKNKPFNNVVQNNEVKQTDFDKLRFAL